MNYLVTCDRFVHDAPGGAYLVAWELALQAERDGHEVALLCGTPDRHMAQVTEVEGVRVIRYLLPKLLPIDPRRWTAHVEAAATALKVHAGLNWDVIHVHTLSGGIAAARAGVRGAYVYTVHSPIVLEQQVNWSDGTVSGSLKRILGMPVLKRQERAMIAKAHIVHALSDYTREELGNLYGTKVAERVVVLPWWQERVKAQPRPAVRARLGISEDVRLLFSLRRLVPRMGLDLLISALARHARRNDWQLIIGGDGPQRSALERQVRESGLGGQVSFRGRMTDHEVHDAYSACDAFVLPTRALECFGIIILESFAYGRPVLGARIGAIPELLERITPDWLFNPGDVDALAHLLKRVLDRDLRSPDEDKLKEFVAAGFDREVMSSKYRALIEAAAR